MTAPADLARLLRRLPIFGALAETEAVELVARCSTFRYDPGVRLFQEGDLAESVMVIVSGKVDITCSMADGPEVVVATEGAGAILGEMAVIDLAPRSASATAVEPTVVLVIEAPTFYDLVAVGHPAAGRILREVAATAAQRIRVLDETVDRVAAAGVPGELRTLSPVIRRTLT